MGDAFTKTDEALLDLLQEISRHLVGVTATALAVGRSSNLSLPAYRLMVLVSLEGERSPQGLADKLGVTAAAVSQMLRTLERRGLAVITADPTDGRRRVVNLTELGKNIVQRVTMDRRRRLARVLTHLTETDRDNARRFLPKIERELRRIR